MHLHLLIAQFLLVFILSKSTSHMLSLIHCRSRMWTWRAVVTCSSCLQYRARTAASTSVALCRTTATRRSKEKCSSLCTVRNNHLDIQTHLSRAQVEFKTWLHQAQVFYICRLEKKQNAKWVWITEGEIQILSIADRMLAYFLRTAQVVHLLFCQWIFLVLNPKYPSCLTVIGGRGLSHYQVIWAEHQFRLRSQSRFVLWLSRRQTRLSPALCVSYHI